MRPIIIFWIVGIIIGFVVTGYGAVKAIKSNFKDLNAIIWCWVGVKIVSAICIITLKLL